MSKKRAVSRKANNGETQEWAERDIALRTFRSKGADRNAAEPVDWLAWYLKSRFDECLRAIEANGFPRDVWKEVRFVKQSGNSYVGTLTDAGKYILGATRNPRAEDGTHGLAQFATRPFAEEAAAIQEVLTTRDPSRALGLGFYLGQNDPERLEEMLKCEREVDRIRKSMHGRKPKKVRSHTAGLREFRNAKPGITAVTAWKLLRGIYEDSASLDSILLMDCLKRNGVSAVDFVSEKNVEKVKFQSEKPCTMSYRAFENRWRSVGQIGKTSKR